MIRNVDPANALMNLHRHDLSNPFGEADAKDFDELVKSMLERGYDSLHPIILYEGGILDGWHRYRAAQIANITPTFAEFVGIRKEAQAFVWAENMARRQMSGRQKIAALVLSNSWLGPNEQLSDAEIAVRAGLTGSGRMVSQFRQIGDRDPGLLHDVATGKRKTGEMVTAIRQELGEDPAGDDPGTSPDTKRPTVVFELKSKKLIARSHKARLNMGMAKQSWFNKAIELACEWAENQNRN